MRVVAGCQGDVLVGVHADDADGGRGRGQRDRFELRWGRSVDMGRGAFGDRGGGRGRGRGRWGAGGGGGFELGHGVM